MESAKLKYFIGGDVHSSTTTFTVLDEGNHLIETRTLPTQERVLREYLRALPSPKGLAIEETDLAQWLFTVLSGEVQELVVCDPYRNHLLKEGAKNDQIDARKLAELYRSGLVKSVFHQKDSRMDLRKLTASYRETMKNMVRTKNQVKAILRRCGQEDDNLSTIDRKVLQINEERLELLLQQKDFFDAEFEKISRRFSEISWLQSVPGIGIIGAVKILATVVEPKRFENKHVWWSYCGLVRHGRESAGKSYGFNHSQANREMKCVFKTAAITALRGQGPMKTYYENWIKKGLEERHARNALARKIAAIALCCWKEQRKFKPFFERKKQEKSETMN